MTLLLDIGRLFHRYETRNHRSFVSGALAPENQGARRHPARHRDGSRYDAVRESPRRWVVHIVFFTRLVRFRPVFAYVRHQGIHEPPGANHGVTNISMGCTPGSFLAIGLTGDASDARGHQIDKRRTIDAGVASTLARLYTTAKDSRELAGKARNVLVFPSVIAAGLFVGGR